MGTSEDCGLVLDAATVDLLGSGPFCKFASPSILSVVMGSEASIRPQGSADPHFVALVPDTIGSAAGGVPWFRLSDADVGPCERVSGQPTGGWLWTSKETMLSWGCMRIYKCARCWPGSLEQACRSDA